MNESRPAERLAALIESAGLGPLVAGLIEAGAGPLGFLAAQGLYLAQPAIGAFADERRVAEWAAWLEDPAGLGSLAERLQAQDTGHKMQDARCRMQDAPCPLPPATPRGTLL